MTLEEFRQELEKGIHTNNSAMALIVRCGGNYDDTEDIMKKTLDCLIKVRKEYKEEKIKIENNKNNMQEVLNIFGIMGMM